VEPNLYQSINVSLVDNLVNGFIRFKTWETNSISIIRVMTEIVLVSETLDLINPLTLLSARESCFKSCRRGNFQTYVYHSMLLHILCTHSSGFALEGIYQKVCRLQWFTGQYVSNLRHSSTVLTLVKVPPQPVPLTRNAG
jgi:hypothetical protein